MNKYGEIFKDLRISLRGIERAAMDIPIRPHRNIEETDLIAEYFVKKDGKKIPFFNQELSLFGITEEDLFRTAMENMEGRLVCKPIMDGMCCISLNYADGMSGVEAILHPDAMKEVAKITGNEFMVIPTSKTEAIAMAADLKNERLFTEARRNLAETNGGIHPDDVVSGNIYVFRDGRIAEWSPLKKEPRFLFDMDGTLIKWRGCEDVSETFQPGYFLERETDPLILKVFCTLFRRGMHVGILSAVYTTETAQREKLESLRRAGILVPEIDVIFIPYGQKKADFIDKTVYENILVDDYTLNLAEWEDSGLPAVKYYNGINGTNGTWKGASINKNMSVKDAIKVITSV